MLGDVSEIKGCVEVKVTVLGPFLIAVLISVNIKQHVKKTKMADTLILPNTAVQPLVLWQCLAVPLWQWVISKEAVGQAWGILIIQTGSYQVNKAKICQRSELYPIYISQHAYASLRTLDVDLVSE